MILVSCVTPEKFGINTYIDTDGVSSLGLIDVIKNCSDSVTIYTNPTGGCDGCEGNYISSIVCTDDNGTYTGTSSLGLRLTSDAACIATVECGCIAIDTINITVNIQQIEINGTCN